MNLFDGAVADIKQEYDNLGHNLGWRFLCVSKSTLNPSTKIALITANPGGNINPKDHPTASCEEGSAYLVEQWGAALPGQNKLQKQVQSLFRSLAQRAVHDKVSGEVLLEQSLIAYFIPFRSPRLAELHRPDESLRFAQRLWTKLFGQIRPRLVIAIDRDTYDALGPIIENTTGARRVEPGELFPTGWGTYKANVDEYRSDNYQMMLVRLPHLSTFQIFTSQGCRDCVRDIIDLACKHI